VPAGCASPLCCVRIGREAGVQSLQLDVCPPSANPAPRRALRPCSLAVSSSLVWTSCVWLMCILLCCMCIHVEPALGTPFLGWCAMGCGADTICAGAGPTRPMRMRPSIAHLTVCVRRSMHSQMELVRRHSGRYDLSLPFFLPTGYGHVKFMNSMTRECVDCRTSPPAKWSIEQVGTQLAVSGMQGRPLGAAVARRFVELRIDGPALLALNRSALSHGLGLSEQVVAMLEPWVRRLRSDNAKVWAFGVHCCARWLTNMPSKEDWLQILTLPVLGPLRPKEASVHRIGGKGKRFLEAFKAFHQAREAPHAFVCCALCCTRLPKCAVCFTARTHCHMLNCVRNEYRMQHNYRTAFCTAATQTLHISGHTANIPIYTDLKSHLYM
jgi:hypothetical protein